MAIEHNKFLIQKVEKSLKRQIESFFITEFPENILFSHGIGHHRRVWNYAVELINSDYINIDDLNESFVVNLLVACYFHDIGMAENQDKNHGATSRKKCLKFFAKYNLNPDNFKEALDAIEFHDDKTYAESKFKNNTLSILSSADDLDAFGFIGIYRYADIYLRRNVKKSDIGKMILENAKGRFENFINNKNTDNDFFKKHIDRYNILKDFFSAYNKDIEHYNSIDSMPRGYCGIIDIIHSLINNMEKPDFSKIFSEYSSDCIISQFAAGITEELKNH